MRLSDEAIRALNSIAMLGEEVEREMRIAASEMVKCGQCSASRWIAFADEMHKARKRSQLKASASMNSRRK